LREKILFSRGERERDNFSLRSRSPLKKKISLKEEKKASISIQRDLFLRKDLLSVGERFLRRGRSLGRVRAESIPLCREREISLGKSLL